MASAPPIKSSSNTLVQPLNGSESLGSPDDSVGTLGSVPALEAVDVMKVEPSPPVTASTGAVASITTTAPGNSNNSKVNVSSPAALQNTVAVPLDQTEPRANQEAGNISATSGVVASNTDNHQIVNQTENEANMARKATTATVPVLKSSTVNPVLGDDSSAMKPSTPTLDLPGHAMENPNLSGAAGLPVEGQEDPVLNGTIVEPIQPLDNSTRVNIVSQTQSNQTTDRQAGTE